MFRDQIIKMLIKSKQEWRNLGCKECKCVPTVLIKMNYQQLSKETKILKIGQYLAEIANCNDFFLNHKMDTFRKSLAPNITFTIYSSLSNNRAGWNKHAGQKISQN